MLLAVAAALALLAWRPAARLALGAAAPLCLLGAAVALASLLGGDAPALRLGLLSAGGMVLGLDPLSALFCVPCLLAAAAACAAPGPPAAPRIGPLAAAALLTLLAGDMASLLLGVGAVWLSLVWLGASPAGPGAAGSARRLRLAALLGTASLAASLWVLGGVGDNPGFAPLRAGGAGWALPPFAWLAGGALLGLPPFGFWRPRGVAATPALRLGAAGLAAPLGAYLAIRLLADLGAGGARLWWGLALLAAGLASSVHGAWGACRARETQAVLARLRAGFAGLPMAALGVALLGRVADLPLLAGAGEAAALLLAVVLGLAGALAELAAGWLEQQAGSRRLDRLGGLATPLGGTVGGLGAGLLALALLPPGAGFGGVWLLLQGVLAAPRFGALGLQAALAGAVALLGLGPGLLAAASLRLLAVVALGRPRTPRAAAAEPPPAGARRAILWLAGLVLALGALPWLVLRPAARALSALTGGEGVAPAGPLGLDAPGGGALLALPVAALLAGLLCLAWAWLVGWRLPRLAPVRKPAWADGFAAPPAWLPFGDPATQVSADGATALLAEALGPVLTPPCRHAALRRLGRRLGAWQRPPIWTVGPVWLWFALLVFLLVALALGAAP